MGEHEYVEMTLDLTGCKSLHDLHERIMVALEFPDYYGHNWSAFWDCLSFDCRATHIRIIGEHTLSEEFQENLDMMHEILTECKEEREQYGDIFEIEIVS